MFLSILIAAAFSAAESTDTIRPVSVFAEKAEIVSVSDTVTIRDKSNVTEVLQAVPGLLVNDNGGYSGLKTVSLRGMGSAFTDILIDGVKLGNVQSGQADLGFPGMENYSEITVDYVGNSISFNTARPVSGNRLCSGKVRMEAGSFGTWIPSARLDFRLSPKMSLSASCSGTVSRGDFPYDGETVREGNDIRQIRSGLDLWYNVRNGEWHTKAFLNSSDRGVPGSVYFPSADRQLDRNLFIQSSYSRQFSEMYRLKLSGKASYDSMDYTGGWGDSHAVQNEFQLNTSHIFHPGKWLDLVLRADFHRDGLEASYYDASRLRAHASFGPAIRLERLHIDTSVECEYIFDRNTDMVSGDVSEKNTGSFCPSMQLRYAATSFLDIVAFGKRAVRTPTFNELYYVGFGNPELSPEKAVLCDIGVDFKKKNGRGWLFRSGFDGFYNQISDKIISSPTEEDPNIWLPFNIGKVRSMGLDASASVSFNDSVRNFLVSVKYSLQDVTDRTPGSESYGSRIPYVPVHSLNACLRAGLKGWSFETVWNLRAQRTDSMGELPDWNTLDAEIAKAFCVGKGMELSIMAKVTDIFDMRYEISSGYPLPGRSVYLMTSFRF